jgi:hypothetical protein
VPQVRPVRRAPQARPAARVPARQAAQVPLTRLVPRGGLAPRLVPRCGLAPRAARLARRLRFLAPPRRRQARRLAAVRPRRPEVRPRQVPTARLVDPPRARQPPRCRLLLPGLQARRPRPGQDGRAPPGLARQAGRALPAGRRIRLKGRRRAPRDGPGSRLRTGARVSRGRRSRQAPQTTRRTVPGLPAGTGCRKGTARWPRLGPMTGSGSGPTPATAVTAWQNRTGRPMTTIPRIPSGRRTPTDRRPTARPISTALATTVPRQATVRPLTASRARPPRARPPRARTARPARIRQLPARLPRRSLRARRQQVVPHPRGPRRHGSHLLLV